ncbi:MAG: hypothetical protein V8R55_04295 [Dysosmobacter sp.]
MPRRTGESVAEALESALAQTDAGAVAAFEASALETAAQVRAEQSAPLLYGMGATAEVAAGLKQGRITATAAKNEFAAGYLAVEPPWRAPQRGRRAVPDASVFHRPPGKYV